MSAATEHSTELLIGGERVAGTGPALAVENPYTTETIAELGAASLEQVDAAVAAAREAWPGWARLTAGERCELLHEVARRLRAEAEPLARTMTAGSTARAEAAPLAAQSPARKGVTSMTLTRPFLTTACNVVTKS